MSLENQIEELEEEVLKKLSEPLAARELEELQVATLGKKGRLTDIIFLATTARVLFQSSTPSWECWGIHAVDPRWIGRDRCRRLVRSGF